MPKVDDRAGRADSSGVVRACGNSVTDSDDTAGNSRERETPSEYCTLSCLSSFSLRAVSPVLKSKSSFCWGVNGRVNAVLDEDRGVMIGTDGVTGVENAIHREGREGSDAVKSLGGRIRV